MKFKAVDFATYIISDLNRSIDFYQNTLGLNMTSKGDSWAEFQIGDVALAIGTWGNAKAQGKGNGIALAVDDVNETLRELKKKGVKVDEESWETPVCFGGTFEDPDGNKIYLHSRKDGTAG